MKSLPEHVVENASARRTRARSRAARGIAAETGPVQLIKSLGLDAASVALPAGVTLEQRAERMNRFWTALADLQYRDIVVVALCANTDR